MTRSVVSSVRRRRDPWSLTSAAGGVTTSYDITSVEEVDTRVGQFTVDRVEFVDTFETWQYSDTSHVKLCARHPLQDTRDELAGVLPTACRTKRGLHVSRAIQFPAPTETRGRFGHDQHLRVDGDG